MDNLATEAASIHLEKRAAQLDLTPEGRKSPLQRLFPTARPTKVSPGSTPEKRAGLAEILGGGQTSLIPGGYRGGQRLAGTTPLEQMRQVAQRKPPVKPAVPQEMSEAMKQYMALKAQSQGLGLR